MRGLVQTRAARRFARALDGVTPHGAGRGETQTRELVGVAHRLESMQFDAAPSDEFKARLRQRLVAVAAVSEPAVAGDVVPQPRTPLSDRIAGKRRRTHRRLAYAAGAMTAAVLLGGLTVAESGRALPGDVLYGLKKTTESVQLSLTRSDASAGREHLSIATTRMNEVRDLIGEPDSSLGTLRYSAEGGGLSAGRAALVKATLADMDQQTRVGTRLVTSSAMRHHDDGALRQLGGWASKQRGAVWTLQRRIDGPVAKRLSVSVHLLDRVVSRVNQLRAEGDCSCSAGSDALGPLPCDSCSVGQGPTSTGPGNPTIGPSGSAGTPSTTSSASQGAEHGPTATKAAPSRGPSSSLTPSGTPTTAPSLPVSPSATSTPTGGILPTGILPTDPASSSSPAPSLLPPGLLPSLLGGLLPVGD